uniref:Gag-pol polyprotein n=1 Tax=Solanum tuberosum TaxID=4113 RepID=M1D9N8_SOLTU
MVVDLHCLLVLGVEESMQDLLDPSVNLSFVTPYVAMRVYVLPNMLSDPFSVSTPIGESIKAKKVYRKCLVSLFHRVTHVGLVELDIVRFRCYSCVTHIDDDKKDLVQDVCILARLAVQLVDSTKSGVMVYNRSESSFVSDVKAEKGLDLNLVELKKAVLKESVKTSSNGEMVYWCTLESRSFGFS